MVILEPSTDEKKHLVVVVDDDVVDDDDDDDDDDGALVSILNCSFDADKDGVVLFQPRRPRRGRRERRTSDILFSQP